MIQGNYKSYSINVDVSLPNASTQIDALVSFQIPNVTAQTKIISLVPIAFVKADSTAPTSAESLPTYARGWLQPVSDIGDLTSLVQYVNTDDVTVQQNVYQFLFNGPQDYSFMRGGLLVYPNQVLQFIFQARYAAVAGALSVLRCSFYFETLEPQSGGSPEPVKGILNVGARRLPVS